MPAMSLSAGRRQLRTRTRPLPRRLAGALAGAGVSPDALSLAGIGAAGAAALCLIASRHTGAAAAGLLFVGAALAVQLRLLCNLLDGMVAVEFARHSPRGPLFNEIPDRVEDVLILLAAGYAAAPAVGGNAALGVAAALLALGTAYVRLLGGTLGQVQDFCGPMAKQHRMALLTAALLLAAALRFIGRDGAPVLAVALALIAAGALLTAARRVRRIARNLSA